MLASNFSPEQEMLRDTARGLLDKECPTDLVRSCLEDGRMARDLWHRLGQTGLLGMGLPYEVGGSGGSVAELVIVAGELGRALAPVPWFGAALAARLAVSCGLGTDVIPAALEGATVLSVAIGEHWWTAGAPAQPDVVPERFAVPWGAAADHILLVGGTWEQVTLSIESRPFPDLEIEPHPMLGTQAYDSVRRGAAGVGTTAMDTGALRRVLTEMRVARSAEMVGGARRALEVAVGYAKERLQFGRPIGSFQAVKHRLADMATEVELADLLVWEAAAAVEAGSEQAWDDAAMAKAFAGEAYRQVTAGACQVLGGYGFMLEYDPQLYFRRAKQAQLLEGTSEDLYVEVGARAAGLSAG